MWRVVLVGSIIVVTSIAACKPKPDEDDPTHTVVVREESEPAEGGKEAREAEARASARAPEGKLIPRTMADKGKYYLLESKKSGDIVKAVHKRVGVDSVGWTRTETNCKTMRMREMGYSEEGRDKIPREPTQWFELVEGSSKSDMARFLCKRSK